VVNLVSPALFVKENLGYTVNFDDVYSMIANDLGLKISNNNQDEDDKSQNKNKGFATAIEITGYNSMWNMKMQPVPGISAGSAFVYDLLEPVEIKAHRFVGERNTEGYGEVIIQEVKYMDYEMGKEEKCKNSSDIDEYECSKPIILSAFKKKIMDEMLFSIDPDSSKEKDTDSSKEKINMNTLNPAALGRVTLMLKESMKNEDNKNVSSKVLEDFEKRCKSIKSEGTKNGALSILNSVKKLKVKENIDNPKVYEIMNKVLNEDEIQELYEKHMDEFLMNVLILMKYTNRER